MSTSMPPLLVIIGPTAVGKTETSIYLAEHFNGEIVSADSRLFYRYMDIGTAKPTIEEQTRIPHHLIDIATPDEVISLAVYQKKAKCKIRDITKRLRLPLLVGGTGQYVRAITEDWDIPIVAPNREMRKALEIWAQKSGKVNLHNALKSMDPLAAEKIDPGNLRRAIRALEVIFTTGKKFSEQRGRKSPEYSLLIIGINRPRKELYERIDSRIDRMVANGFVEEVESLLNKGYSFDLPSLSAIGYREIKTFIEGKCSLVDAIVEIKRKSRVFVRRQANWFKKDDPEIKWYDLSATSIVHIKEDIQDWLIKNSKQIYVEQR